MQDSEHKFLFFMERDFHIALLKPLMVYIYERRFGEMKVYAPFNRDISLVLRKYLAFNVDVVENPWAYKPTITFMADFSYQYVEGLGKLVNIGHGTICKGWFYSDKKISQRENCADLLCVPGTIHKERLEKQVFKPIIVTGMPKLDRCFNGSLNREEILRRYGLDPARKTILLAPTFNEEYSILPHLLGKDLTRVFPEDMNLIVKLHGVSDESVKRLFDGMRNEFVSYPPEHRTPNTKHRKLFISDSYESDEVFFASDVLISDVSSVIYEYLSLGKPVLLFDSPRQREYINFDESDLEWQYRDVGMRFSDVYEIPQLLESVFGVRSSVVGSSLPITPNTQYRTPNTADIGARFISVRDGSSAQRVVEAALNAECGMRNYDIVESTNALSNPNTKHRTPNTEYVLFKSPDFQYSPQFDRFMLNQMINGGLGDNMNPNTTHRTPNTVGLVVPLVDDNELHQQHFRSRVSLGQDLNFEQTGIQLGYAFAGHNIEIDFILPHSFMVRRDLLEMRSETHPYPSLKGGQSGMRNDRLFIYELLANAARKGYKVILAYDCLIKPQKADLRPQTSDLRRQEHSSNNNKYDSPALSDHHFSLHTLFDEIVSLDNRGFTKEAFEKVSEIDFKTFTDIDMMMRFMVLKARLMMKIGQIEDVLYYLNQVLQYNENDIEALLTRGIYYLSQNMTGQALADFDRVLSVENGGCSEQELLCNSQVSPQHFRVRALLGKGVISQTANQMHQAASCFAKALEIDPENMEALKHLLQVSWATKDFTQIQTALENYLDYHPGNLEILFSLAGIYVETGRYNEAKERLDMILVLDENYAGARELLKRVSSAQ